MKVDPLINILTRTSNRPKGFKKNRESILRQTYKNINHIVCTDDRENEKYLKDVGVDYMFLDRNYIIKNFVNPMPKSPGANIFSPHNLYLNEMIRYVKDGWILYVDDDDFLANDTVIEEIVNNIVDEDTIMYWKMQYPNGNTLPDMSTFNNKPMLGRIGGSCHGVHSKWRRNIKWDAWKCSDYRVMESLHKTVPKSKWLDIVVIGKGNNGGLGLRKDIK